jgi:hypothetical protein
MAPVKDSLGRKGWQRLVRMLNCYQCAGFWSGVVTGLILLLGHWIPCLQLLLFGFAASFLGPLAAVFLGYLNALSSAAASSEHSAPEASASTSASSDEEKLVPAETDGSAGAYRSKR